MGSRPPSSRGATKTSDFTIWPSSRTDGRGGLARGVGRFVEGDDVEGHALALRCIEDARDTAG